MKKRDSKISSAATATRGRGKRINRRRVSSVGRSELARKKPSPRSFPVSDASCVPICLYIPIDPRPAPSSLCHPTVVPLFPSPFRPPPPSRLDLYCIRAPLREVSSPVARAITLRVIFLAYLYARLSRKLPPLNAAPHPGRPGAFSFPSLLLFPSPRLFLSLFARG